MEALDGWLIGRFEAFAHWWQRLTGLTNFWLARVIDVVMMAVYLPMVMLMVLLSKEFSSEFSRVGLLALIAVMLYSHIGTSRRLCSGFLAMEAYYLDGATAMHPVTLILRSLWLVRMMAPVYAAMLFSVAMLPGNAGLRPPLIATALANIIYAIEFAFASCVPLPPGVSKVRQLVDNWTPRWRRLAPSAS